MPASGGEIAEKVEQEGLSHPFQFAAHNFPDIFLADIRVFGSFCFRRVLRRRPIRLSDHQFDFHPAESIHRDHGFSGRGILIAIGYLVAHFRKNSESEDYCTVMANILLIGQIVLSSIVIGKVRSDMGGEFISPGACPILLLVFSLLVFVTIIVIYFTAGHFYSESDACYMVSPEGYALFEKEISKIAPFAFESCGELMKANVPEGITEIGDNAFSRCAGLNWISLPASLSRIGDYAFYGCGDLHDIVYAGTSSDWDAVDKGYGWCLATHGLVVHCVDKKITP